VRLRALFLLCRPPCIVFVFVDRPVVDRLVDHLVDHLAVDLVVGLVVDLVVVVQPLPGHHLALLHRLVRVLAQVHLGLGLEPRFLHQVLVVEELEHLEVVVVEHLELVVVEVEHLEVVVAQLVVVEVVQELGLVVALDILLIQIHLPCHHRRIYHR